MSGPVSLETWIYGQMHADTGAGGVSTLVGDRIYTDEAPQNSAYPMVLISAQSPAMDIVTLGPHRGAIDALYWVRVVGKGASKAALDTIYARIDYLLQDAGGFNREAQVGTPPFTTDGVRYVQLGGLYRAFVAVP
jgi:hypothetical protein